VVSSRKTNWVLRGVLVGGLAAAVSLIALSPADTRTPSRDGADVVVSALPGVELRHVMNHPEVTAASGPFPTVTTGARNGRRETDLRLEAHPSPASVVDRPVLASGTWARGGSLVLEQEAAGALGVKPGDRITVSALHGPASLRVAGITTGAGASDTPAGYVTPRTLARLVPNARTYGSTLYLRLRDGASSTRFARWVDRVYPGPQVSVSRRPGAARSAGWSPGLLGIALLAVVLACAALVLRAGRPGHGSPGTGVPSHA
jgi:hypothetical protein